MSIPRLPFKPFVMPALLLLPVLPAHAIQSLDPVTVRPAQQEGLQQAASAGSRLGLSIQNTPASVDVISRERIDARGDTTVNEEAAAPRITVEEAMTQCQQASGENADRAVFDA